MLNRIKTLASLYLELGPRWSAFRLAYAFRLRTGIIRLQTPQYAWADRPLKHWLKKNIPSDSESYSAWRKQNAPAFFPTVGAPPPRPDYGTTAIEEANHLLNGELKYFSHEFHKTGFPPNWHKDPITNYQLPTNLHWSQISDDHVAAKRSWSLPKQPPHNRGLLRREEQEPSSQRHVDIKNIWEPNRFAFVYTLVRAYAATGDEKYPQAFWGLIQDWADHNPPNTGANWKDGQEVALRLMAWTFGFYAFIHSPSTTNLQISQFTQLVAAQAERIHANIGYAISTRSNHTISEAFGLWMVGLLFPELKDAQKYFHLGKRLLEEEAARQIFPDGSYAMYSLNYHRFILHLYLYAIQLGEINRNNPSLRAALLPFAAKQSHNPLPRLLRAEERRPRNDDGVEFSDELKERVANSIQYLSTLINPDSGHMPVYGSNDGALVLPLNNCDFTDYRPLLQLGSVITTGKRMFEEGAWDEDIFWLCGDTIAKKEERRKNIVEGAFPDGGVYILRSSNSHAFIRCTNFTSRPSHADQLHMDLWMGSDNIAIDAGTYRYSGEGVWRNGLARTSTHNTVTVDNKDQMTLVSRFTWTNWAKGKVFKHSGNLWQGEHDGYKPIHHKRTVMTLEGDRWLVVDGLEAHEPHHYTLHWLLNDVPFSQNKNSLLLNYEARLYKIQMGLINGEGKFTTLRADRNSTYGWRSRYYAHKEPAISLLLEAQQANVCFYTFLGFENDAIELNGNSFLVNQSAINIPLPVYKEDAH
ncbi:MAG: alginate lyase family protein [Chloroflexi bacterium]|nr:alginate lyase family protein [Chloroflexota bacterium]